MRKAQAKPAAYALLTAAGLAAGLWVCTLISWHGMADALGRADALLLASAGLVALMVNAARAARFCLFFPESGARLRLFATFGLIRLLGLLMPMRSGEVAGLALLKKQGVVPSIAQAAPAWLATRVLDVLVVSSLLAVAMLVRPTGQGSGALMAWLGAACAAGAVTLALAWWLKRSAGDEAALTEGSWLSRRLAAFRTGLGRLTTGRMVAAACWSAGVWVGMGVLVVLTMLAFQTPVTLAAAAMVAMTMIAVTLLPIHGPLGLGSVELAWVVTLGYAGVAQEEAAALAVCYRLALTGMVLLDGSLGLGILAVQRSSRPRLATDPSLCPPA